jgi:hypothetical protein
MRQEASNKVGASTSKRQVGVPRHWSRRDLGCRRPSAGSRHLQRGLDCSAGDDEPGHRAR